MVVRFIKSPRRNTGNSIGPNCNNFSRVQPAKYVRYVTDSDFARDPRRTCAAQANCRKKARYA